MAEVMISVAILGASGRVGRLLVAEWCLRRPRLNLRYQARVPTGPEEFAWRLSDGVAALAKGIGPGVDVLIVLSGVTPAAGADYDLNRALALAAFEAAQIAGVGHVLIASSSAVYGRGQGIALAENAPLVPLNPYGVAKAEMERACQAAHARSGDDGPGLTLLRIGNVAGTDQFFRNIAQAAAPVRLDRFADGSGPVRSYIGPGCLARVLAKLCERAAQCGQGVDRLPMVLNIGAPGGGVDMAAFLPALQAAGYRGVERVPAPDQSIAVLRLDVACLEQLHRFAPGDSDPARMVAEWLELGGGRA